MSNVEKLTEIFRCPPEEEKAFRPCDVDLDHFFPPHIEEKELEESLTLRPEAKIPIKRISPILPEGRVVAIDGTSMTLGHIEDGVVGAVRAALIISEPSKKTIKVRRYGPYLLAPTNQNKQTLYEKMRETVFKITKKAHAPNYVMMIDRARSFLEKLLQLEAAKNHTDSLLLFDGSLISGTMDSPTKFVKAVLDRAAGNRNDVAAISKRTMVSLEPTKKSILSVLKEVHGPCYAEVKPYISQRKERYLGNIFVGKFTRHGEPFRVDIPDHSRSGHVSILSQLSGLAGDYGYPEELKMAHVMCILSSIEVLELQSAATRLYDMQIKEDIRKKIFGPFG